MKKKKLLATILSMCMTASMLAGCGSSAAPSTSDTTANDTAKTESTTASTDTAATTVSLDSLPSEVGQGTITATPEMYASTDLSKNYTVNMYLIGDTPNDWDSVINKVNDYL